MVLLLRVLLWILLLVGRRWLMLLGPRLLAGRLVVIVRVGHGCHLDLASRWSKQCRKRSSVGTEAVQEQKQCRNRAV